MNFVKYRNAQRETDYELISYFRCIHCDHRIEASEFDMKLHIKIEHNKELEVE